MDLAETRRVLGDFATRPVNAVANLASILGLVLTVLATIGWNSAAIPIVYLCALSSFLIVRYVRQERWSRYSEAALVMDRAHRRLKEVTDSVVFGGVRLEDALHGLHDSLSAFAEAFTLVTGSNCRASIKEIYAEAKDAGTAAGSTDLRSELFAATVSRSDRDEVRRIAEERPDLVRENSDFELVVANRDAFHSNDLPRLWLNREYRNSHWPDSLRSSGKFPYTAAIVWPIEADRVTSVRSPISNENVIAVLCVDTRRRGAFRPRVDVPFGMAYAHALYALLYFDRS
ncbi:hypothetical protein [Aeromicrobium sp. Leaf350]|uniref:hypothetical protein n=1 Tax=Aeromicrobium sp. Leaf350 TaxID=2876565 RepID=UPI001E4B2080|nr:hypothetical protein [Aeromicrobium sp. Leaf350]